MNLKREYEFWAIDKDGVKHHDYFFHSSTRDSKIRKYIEETYGISIKECLEFNYKSAVCAE